MTGTLASSTHAQAAFDQCARRKVIFRNCNIVFLNCKSAETKEICKNASPKAYNLTNLFMVYIHWVLYNF